MRFIEKLKRFASKFFDKPDTSTVTVSAPAEPNPLSRREVRRERLLAIHARGAELIPADYLICHQPSDPIRVAKIKAKAEERRQRRNAKRLRDSLFQRGRIVIFTPKSGIVF